MGPWSALKAIPWGTILKRTAVVLAAADALRAHSRQQPAVSTATSDVESLRQRIGELEQQQHANAELVKQLADQTRAIAIGAQAMAAKTRQAFVLAIVGVTLGVLSLLLVLLR